MPFKTEGRLVVLDKNPRQHVLTHCTATAHAVGSGKLQVGKSQFDWLACFKGITLNDVIKLFIRASSTTLSINSNSPFRFNK